MQTESTLLYYGIRPGHPLHCESSNIPISWYVEDLFNRYIN